MLALIFIHKALLPRGIQPGFPLFKLVKFTPLASIVQIMDNDIHWVNCQPVDKCFKRNTLPYPLESDLFCGQYCPPFEQLGPAGKLMWSD